MWRTQTIEIMFVPVDHISRRINMIPVKSQVRLKADEHEYWSLKVSFAADRQ